MTKDNNTGRYPLGLPNLFVPDIFPFQYPINECIS